MKKVHKNEVKVVIPEYETIREIIVKGTAAGGDKKQFMFLDKHKNMQEINYNQSWKLISSLGTYFFSKGLKNGSKSRLLRNRSRRKRYRAYGLQAFGR